MDINITAENLLIQLDNKVTDATLAQMNKIIDNTNGFDSFSKHILSLKDELAHLHGYINMSNSKDYLKIKTDLDSVNAVEEFDSIVHKWAQKYKVAVDKVADKNTYYIIGLL